jgi:hypothetical protein
MKPTLIAALLLASVSFASANDCILVAQAPTQSFEGDGPGHLTASGSRGPNCAPSSVAEVTVSIKQNRRFWFDKTLAVERKTGSNITVFVRYDCTRGGGMRVYTQVKTRWNKVKSPTVSAQLCK